MNNTTQYNGEVGKLVLPKSVYEPLPYFYILVGVAIVVGVSTAATFVSGSAMLIVYLCGALLYAAGCSVWVLRSSNRRKNSRTEIRNRQGSIVFPEWAYEYLPFVYIWLGVAVLALIESPVRFLPGGLLCLAGGLIWIIRAIYRNQDPATLKNIKAEDDD